MEITGKKHVRLSKFNAIRRAVDAVVDCQLMGFFNLTQKSSATLWLTFHYFLEQISPIRDNSCYF